MPFADSAAVFIVVPIDDVMDRLDGPMFPIDFEHLLWRHLFRRSTGDAQGGLDSVFAGLFIDCLALDEPALADMREVEVIVECGGAPDTSCFDATMGQLPRLSKVRRTARGEKKSDVVLKGRLVAFDGEMVVRSALDDVSRQGSLGQEGISGDVPPGNVATLEQRDGHADLIGLFLYLAAGSLQGSHFFFA